MTHSPRCTALVEAFEGCRLTAYQDPGGVWTIGYGHTGDVSPNQVCTLEQAREWLNSDLAAADAAVNRLVDLKLNQNQFNALVSFVYNVGAGHFERSTMRNMLNRGETLAAAAQFPKWSMVKDEFSSGLFHRRIAERDLFMEAA